MGDISVREAAAPYSDYLQTVWGDELPALLRFVQATTPCWKTQEFPRFERAVRSDVQSKRVLVVVGQRDKRCLPEQIMAVAAIGRCIALQVGEKNHDLSRRCSGMFHVLFTGGVQCTLKKFAEMSALDMMIHFRQQFGREFEEAISIDQFSVNTVQQSRLIADLIRRFEIARVVVLLPREHISRFIATLGFALENAGGGFPAFYCGAMGKWSDWTRDHEHPTLTRRREAFGPIQQLGDPDVLEPWKLLGGENGERLKRACDGNAEHPQSALSPTRMMEMLRE
jgi:hypothetical protein